jgi:hypothetical protein
LDIPDAVSGALSQWIRTGCAESGMSPLPEVGGTLDDPPGARKEHLHRTVKELMDRIAADFLSLGVGWSGEGFSRISTVGQFARVPMFHEIAQDAHDALTVIANAIEGVNVDAARNVQRF